VYIHVCVIDCATLAVISALEVVLWRQQEEGQEGALWWQQEEGQEGQEGVLSW
jgi:hypothetical protein